MQNSIGLLSGSTRQTTFPYMPLAANTNNLTLSLSLSLSLPLSLPAVITSFSLSLSLSLSLGSLSLSLSGLSLSLSLYFPLLILFDGWFSWHPLLEKPYSTTHTCTFKLHF